MASNLTIRFTFKNSGHRIQHYAATMVFDLLEFNKRYKYYWWLENRSPSWGRRSGEVVSWGGIVITSPMWGIDENSWKERLPTTTPPEETEEFDYLDYQENPPLNRKCNEENIQETILAEFVSWGRNEEHLELYFRVYNSISSRIIRKIARKGLDDANKATYDENDIVKRIRSYLPSGLPVDWDGMQEISERILKKIKKKRIEEEARLQKQKEQMELSRCLICRGIETILQTTENTDDTPKMRSREALNEGMKTYLKADSWKRQCVKRTRWDVDKVWAERMESVKFIYLKVRLFE